MCVSGVGINIDVLKVWYLFFQKKDFELVWKKFSLVLELFGEDQCSLSVFMTSCETYPVLPAFITQQSLPLGVCQQKEKRLLTL